MLQSISSPILSLALAAGANGYFMTFLTVYQNSINIPETIVGSMHSIYYLGMLCGALQIEKKIVTIGHIRSYSTYIALNVASILLMGLVKESMYFWLFIRFFSGYCLAGIYVVIEGWLLALSPKDKRGTVISIYAISLYGSQSLSQKLLLIYPIDHLNHFILASMILSISVIPVLVTTKEVPKIIEAPKIKVWKIVQATPISIVGCLISGILLSVVLSYGPQFAVDNELNVSEVMTMIILGGVFLPFIYGKLSDLYSRRIVLLLITSLILPIALSNKLWIYTTWQSYIALFMLGGIIFSTYPICIANLIDYTKEEYIINATACALLAYGIGSVLGPISIYILSYYFSNITMYIFISCIASIFILSILISYTSLLKTRRQLRETEFIPLVETTSVINELDPRS